MFSESEDAKNCSAVMPARNPTYFYHSFPRLPHQNNDALGLKILDSILANGLLLTAELRNFPACEGLVAAEFIQRRVCFTALTANDLAYHAQTFGSFSLEFEGAALRDFGALPAVYFSGRLPTGEIFNRAGEILARHLLEVHNLLGRLWNLHDEGVEDKKKLAKALLNEIHLPQIPIQTLYFTLQALLNLYYPTDDAKRTAPLHYYQQREWKIVPNLSFAGNWHYRDLTPEERSALLLINPDFFTAIIGGKSRVDHCSYFADVNGKNLVDSVRRILVPDAVADEARNIVTARGRDFDVVPVSPSKL